MTGVGDLLVSYSSALNALEDGLAGSRTALQTTHDTLRMVIAVLERLAGSESLNAVTNVLSGDSETLAAYMATPVQMRTETVYPIREYGSAMAPFYTVLAQWVGALLSVVLIKAQVKPSDEIGNLKLYERFFGRYALLLLVGLSQGLIVSLGDLIYIGIQCPHPLLFVVAAWLNGVVFTLINYALVFALDNIGLALGKNITHSCQHTGGHVVEVLTLLHDVEVVVGRDLKDAEHLVQGSFQAFEAFPGSLIQRIPGRDKGSVYHGEKIVGPAHGQIQAV